jgi:tRNA dimethylallyltransferase
MENSSPRFVAVLGPTASGKSALALDLATRHQGELICIDSVQLYRGFEIGAAAPSPEDFSVCPHHLFGSLQWFEPCDAAKYAAIARLKIEQVLQRGRLPIIVGGTGLYFRSLRGLHWDQTLAKDDGLRAELGKRPSEDLYQELVRRHPVRAKALHKNDRYRVIRALEILHMGGDPMAALGRDQEEWGNPYVIIVDLPRAVLHDRIERRVDQMLAKGLCDEVASLLKFGVTADAKPMQSIGYREVVDYLSGNISKEELRHKIVFSTRQYAKRQCTWFKKVSRDLTVSNLDNLSPIHINF